jgi:hypothetical protein
VTEVQAPAALTPCEPERPAPAPVSAENAAPASDTTPLRAEEAYLEMVAPDGTKLTLRIPVSHLISAAALVREFRSPR